MTMLTSKNALGPTAQRRVRWRQDERSKQHPRWCGPGPRVGDENSALLPVQALSGVGVGVGVDS